MVNLRGRRTPRCRPGYAGAEAEPGRRSQAPCPANLHDRPPTPRPERARRGARPDMYDSLVMSWEVSRPTRSAAEVLVPSNRPTRDPAAHLERNVRAALMMLLRLSAQGRPDRGSTAADPRVPPSASCSGTNDLEPPGACARGGGSASGWGTTEPRLDGRWSSQAVMPATPASAKATTPALSLHASSSCRWTPARSVVSLPATPRVDRVCDKSAVPPAR